MTPLLQQLPALVGVIVGALATYLATAAAERARWQRAQRSRWDESRMNAYAQYGVAVKHMAWLAVRIAAARGLPFTEEPLDPEVGVAQLAAAEGERTVRWETVLLLGDAETVAAARSWHQSVMQLVWFARGKLSGQTEWNHAIRHMEAKRDRF
jgi:hypothetical protein